jgi:hypothetical protein
MSRITVILILLASLAGAQTFPEDSGIQFSYALDQDTVTFQLESEETLEHFWLSEHSDSAIIFIDCFLDGSPAIPEVEIDSVYPGLSTKRFIINRMFSTIVLRYVCRNLTNKMNWVAIGPAFGILGDIGPPVQVRWIDY